MIDQDAVSCGKESYIPLSGKIFGEGKDKVILLLHGWGLSAKELYPLAELLQSHREVHCLDLPGFGKTPFPKNAWSSLDYAKCLNYYIQEMRIKKVEILGHSFGGKVAAQFATLYPEKAEKLIFVSSSGLNRKRTIPEALKFLGIRSLGKILKTLDKTISTKVYETWFIPKFASSDYKNAKEMRPTLLKTLKEDLTGVFSNIQAKSLILWGEEDRETPLQMGIRIHRLIKDSMLIVLERKGHNPFEGVGSHLIAKYILNFLNGR